MQSVAPPGLLSRFRYWVMRANLVKRPPDPSLRSELAEIYREDIANVQDLIGRDLTHWWAESSRGGVQSG